MLLLFQAEHDNALQDAADNLMQALKDLLDFSKETSNDIDAIDHLVAAFDNVKSEVNINVAREFHRNCIVRKTD